VLGILLAWFLASVGFIYSCRGQERRDIQNRAVAYFVLELGLITLLVHYTGGADWLGAIFFTFTILSANAPSTCLASSIDKRFLALRISTARRSKSPSAIVSISPMSCVRRAADSSTESFSGLVAALVASPRQGG